MPFAPLLSKQWFRLVCARIRGNGIRGSPRVVRLALVLGALAALATVAACGGGGGGGGCTPAAETCNGADDDCDGQIDEAGAGGCTAYLRDDDADGYGLDGDTQCTCAAAAPYTATVGGECADADETVHPGATEICNGADDDCDGTVDPVDTSGCTPFLRDDDADGYGLEADQQCLCAAVEPYAATVGNDCNDGDGNVFPGATEACNGVDDDCDASVDEGLAGCCTPDDSRACGVNEGICQVGTETCGADRAWGACLDAGGSAVTLPGQVAEACNDVDDDCDGRIDEANATGCATFMRDEDGDGVGLPTDVACLCVATAPYTATAGTDCNDQDANVYPGAAEVCNGVDDDCDGQIDQGLAGCCTPDDVRACGADQGICVAGTETCGADRAWGVCLDAGGSPVTLPGQVAESCNAQDDDCDGTTDEAGATGCTTYYYDADGDTFGVTSQSQCLCAVSGNYRTTTSGDCDDNYASIYPGAVEVCNGIDDNCDGQVDEGLTNCCTPSTTRACGVDQGICVAGTQTCSGTREWGPCLDAGGNPVTLPGEVAESCNGADDDCDGTTDEANATGCTSYYYDADADGYGIAGQSQCLCAPTGLYRATVAGDCNDGNASINPGRTEICNGIDDNCNGAIDTSEVPVNQICPNTYQVTSTSCTGAGGCAVAACASYYYNVDGYYANGCEVVADSFDRNGQGAACASSYYLGVLYDVGSPYVSTVTGNIVPAGDSDWYYFYGYDSAPSGKDLHVDVRFLSNPGSGFAFQIYRGSCSTLLCSSGTNYTCYSDFNFTGTAGMQDCIQPDASGYYYGLTSHCAVSACSNAYYYVRVYRPDGQASSATYTIEFSNNKY